MNHCVSVCPTRVGVSCLRFLILAIVALTFVQLKSNLNAQDQDKVVAVVNGRKITQLEVDRSVTAKLGPLQQQIYELRKIALENLILRTVLEDEAKKRGISVDALKKELTDVKVEVPERDVEQLYAENVSAFGNVNPDEARERLRLDLEGKARMRSYRDTLSKLRERAGVTLTLVEPTLPIGNIIEHAPFRGANTPLVTIIEFSDFQCPYCKESQATLLKLWQSYGNQVKFVFKHLPLQIHVDAFSAAKAAVCAGEQGSFWQYHDALFASNSFESEALTRIAAKLGMDSQKFKTCFDSAASNTAVLRDMQDAQLLGINGTPSFIVNGTLYRGALSFEDFTSIIDNKLKLAKPLLP